MTCALCGAESESSPCRSCAAGQMTLPLARATDPSTSHRAAAAVGPGNRDAVTAIRTYLAHLDGVPASHEEIADYVERAHPGRWARGSIVAACSRAGLRAVGETTNRRGQPVKTWVRAVPVTSP